MTVQQLIDLAKNGELNQLSVASNTEVVLGYINLGMIELYKRFPLNVKEYLIQLQNGVEIYTMPSDFMWVVKVYGEVDELSENTVCELPLNEEDEPLSVNTVSWNQLQVPVQVTGEYISVIYAASPIMYTMDDLAASVALPPQLMEPMLSYIGYRANSALTSAVNEEHSVHFNRFEISCNRVKTEGMLTSDDMSMKNRITTKGFI